MFILSCLLGQPGVTHAPFYAMNGEHDRVDVTIALSIYIYIDIVEFTVLQFCSINISPSYLVEAAE